MKKLLALVLALVMTLSLAVVGSNAAFKDADKVNETYAEAVDVLAGMKVFQGYTDGSFQPEGSITRAEVAAIVYRLYTGDVADKQASLYASYNKFNDMDGAAWAKGYIGYCANAGLVKGYDAKTFAPQDKVTGYQALAMILRAVGYDKNGEFVGADWQLHVAQTAQQLGVLKNVKGEDLNAAASRQLVAELLFQTAANVPMVNYTAALGYTNLDSILNGKTNATLGYKNFGLTKDKTYGADAWGRPAYVWYGEFSGNNNYNEKTNMFEYPTLVAGNFSDTGCAEGTGGAARFGTLWCGIFVKNADYVANPRGDGDEYDFYVVGNEKNDCIWKVTPDGVATIVAGRSNESKDGRTWGYIDGDPLQEARFEQPKGLAYDETDQTWYIYDYVYHALRYMTVE